MTKRRYLVLFRNQPTGGQPGPSPEQMQQMFAAYKAWMEKFKDDILDNAATAERHRERVRRRLEHATICRNGLF